MEAYMYKNEGDITPLLTIIYLFCVKNDKIGFKTARISLFFPLRTNRIFFYDISIKLIAAQYNSIFFLRPVAVHLYQVVNLMG